MASRGSEGQRAKSVTSDGTSGGNSRKSNQQKDFEFDVKLRSDSVVDVEDTLSEKWRKYEKSKQNRVFAAWHADDTGQDSSSQETGPNSSVMARAGSVSGNDTSTNSSLSIAATKMVAQALKGGKIGGQLEPPPGGASSDDWLQFQRWKQSQGGENVETKSNQDRKSLVIPSVIIEESGVSETSGKSKQRNLCIEQNTVFLTVIPEPECCPSPAPAQQPLIQIVLPSCSPASCNANEPKPPEEAAKAIQQVEAKTGTSTVSRNSIQVQSTTAPTNPGETQTSAAEPNVQDGGNVPIPELIGLLPSSCSPAMPFPFQQNIFLPAAASPACCVPACAVHSPKEKIAGSSGSPESSRAPTCLVQLPASIRPCPQPPKRNLCTVTVNKSIDIKSTHILPVYSPDYVGRKENAKFPVCGGTPDSSRSGKSRCPHYIYMHRSNEESYGREPCCDHQRRRSSEHHHHRHSHRHF